MVTTLHLFCVSCSQVFHKWMPFLGRANQWLICTGLALTSTKTADAGDNAFPPLAIATVLSPFCTECGAAISALTRNVFYFL